MSAEIVVSELGGLCPVQGTGTIDGVPFYFRARHEAWSIEIGHGNTDCYLAATDAARLNQSKDGSHETPADAGARVQALPTWYYDEAYKPGEMYAAGYMEMDEARAFIEQAAERWRAREVPS